METVMSKKTEAVFYRKIPSKKFLKILLLPRNRSTNQSKVLKPNRRVSWGNWFYWIMWGWQHRHYPRTKYSTSFGTAVHQPDRHNYNILQLSKVTQFTDRSFCKAIHIFNRKSSGVMPVYGAYLIFSIYSKMRHVLFVRSNSCNQDLSSSFVAKKKQIKV